MTARYIVGDTRAVLANMPEQSVDLVLTSPPFLALRSYLPPGHPWSGWYLPNLIGQTVQVEAVSAAAPMSMPSWETGLIVAAHRLHGEFSGTTILTLEVAQ